MTLHTPVFVQPVVGDANFPNGIPFTAQELRRDIEAILSVASPVVQSGVTGLDGQFAVTQHAAGANFSVDVATGHAFVPGTDIANQFAYGCWNDGVVNVPTPAPPATGTENHRLVLQIQDKFSNGVWTGYTANLNLLADTGSGTPAQPASSITLALIAISAGQASVLNANITDQRPMLGGTLRLAATALPELINNTAAQGITGCSGNLSARTYIYRVIAQFLANQTGGGPSMQISVSAPMSSQWGNGRILQASGTGAGANRVTVVTSGAMIFPGPALNAGGLYEVEINGEITCTGNGVISLQAFTSIAADTFSIENASLYLTPA